LKKEDAIFGLNVQKEKVNSKEKVNPEKKKKKNIILWLDSYEFAKKKSQITTSNKHEKYNTKDNQGYAYIIIT
jgi:hypothetical protein